VNEGILERPILIEGDPRLRAVAAPVAALDDHVRRDAAEAVATLTAFRARHGFGRGLAAPQIGVSRRLIALDVGAGPFVVFNPEITFRSPELFEVWDDCFSVPDKLVRVRRHLTISLVYRDDGFRERVWERLPPDLAELLQHEVDHLDGILMTDRATGDDAVRPASERAALVDAVRPRRHAAGDLRRA
jgi:peptide deformylase